MTPTRTLRLGLAIVLASLLLALLAPTLGSTAGPGKGGPRQSWKGDYERRVEAVCSEDERGSALATCPTPGVVFADVE